MSKRRFYFVVVLILNLNGEIFSQTVSPVLISGDKELLFDSQHFNISPTGISSQYFLPRNPLISQLNLTSSLNDLSGKNFRIYSPVARDFYQKSLGFMCQKEWQLEKLTTIPLRFRLGSLAYTDYLEGKTP